MGIFNLNFRDLFDSDNIEQVKKAIGDEFDNVSSTISTWATVEHNQDGSHNFKGKQYGLVPLGAMVEWHSGLPIPTYWLSCSGATVSRTTYVNLFKVIGIKYGAGDGVNTFQLPTVSNFIILAGV